LGYLPSALLYVVAIPMLYFSGNEFHRAYRIIVPIVSVLGLLGIYGAWMTYNWLIKSRIRLNKRAAFVCLSLGCLANVLVFAVIGHEHLVGYFLFLSPVIVSLHMIILAVRGTSNSANHLRE
jgi:hypothetical protein